MNGDKPYDSRVERVKLYSLDIMACGFAAGYMKAIGEEEQARNLQDLANRLMGYTCGTNSYFFNATVETEGIEEESKEEDAPKL